MADRALLLASKYSYFTALLSKSKRCINSLNLGHSGSLFQENIKSEWMHSNVFNRDVNVYLYVHKGPDYTKDFINSFTTTYETCEGKFPFGIAETYSDTNNNGKEASEDNYFQSISSKVLSSTMFLPTSDSMQYFLHWQRQRKLWWKKISSFPGRFQLSEISVNNDTFSVDIFANFSWGKQLLENITISPMENNLDKIKIESITKVSNKLLLDIAIVGLFCDAFNEDLLTNTRILKLNRRLTPYKCSFAINKAEPVEMDELAQLAFYLNKLFRKRGIPTVLLSDCTSSIETQFQRNDEWGIPYTVVLDEDSLKSGIVRLRNRDTTLQEEVHVSELAEYVTRLFNDFKK